MQKTDGRVIRFDLFEADLAARELRKRGVRLKLQDQPFQVLAILLEKPGEVATRDELQQRVWGDDTYVDFDKSLSAAVNKVRQALDDSRTRPRFVETLPKVGYRFIGEIDAATREHSVKGGDDQGTSRGRALPWGRWALPAVLAAVALLALVFGPRSEPLEQRTPLKTVPLTTYEGSELFPTFSPDGSQIAFIWAEHEDDAPAIYVRSVESEQPHRVTDHAGRVGYPAWSPDGGSIAYLLEGETGCELRLISPTGGASRTVTALAGPLGEFFHTRLAWSPDGRFIAYAEKPAADEPEALFAVELETRETRRLTHPPAGIYGDGAPSFAWEANELAFIRRFSMYGANEIRTLHLDEAMRPAQDSIAVPLRGPLPVRAARSVIWSEDDDELLYLLRGVLWRAPARGGEATRVLAAGARAIHATLSRQKGRLAFSQYRQDEDIWRLDRESGETRPLVTSTQSDKYHSISPDGERIAWTSFRSGFSEIWVCNADGSEPLQLTSLESFSGCPTWSPDGKLIAFDTRVNGSGDIYVVDSSGGVPRPLLEGPYDDLMPAWSADGGTLYFWSQRDGPPAIWSIKIETGETERVNEAGNAGRWAKTSPDGRFLYFGGVSSYGGDQGLYRKRLADGEETAILDGVFATAPVAGGVYYALRDPAGIQYMDVESGVVEQVLALEQPAYHLAISPDEQTILFTQSEPRQADLMLIEGFW